MTDGTAWLLPVHIAVTWYMTGVIWFVQLVHYPLMDGVGRERLMRDMDAWGYSFRLGSTRCWFERDADDARSWLIDEGLLTADGEATFRLRA